MADRSGQQLGNYRLTRLLGQGGFADVYLGEHVYLKTQAAIKVLQTHMKPNELQNFLTEAQTIAALKHPRIVRVLDFGVESGTPFLVMEYAPNGTLRDRHPRGTILSVATVLPYVKQVAAALQYAHDHTLIHRDVKPANILVETANDLLLSDFGIAIIAHKTQSLSTQEAIGTVTYMAPEQIKGKARPASDQYALGIIVYEWLCGVCPFNGPAIAIAMSHLTDTPASLRAKVPSISVEVEQVVLKALEKEPQQRFVSVQAFAEAFEQASQPPASALPPTVYVPSSPPASALPPTQRASISPTVPAQPITSSDFPMFGYDPQHTHYNPHERILSPTNVSRLVPYWTASTGGQISASPVVANGVVYVGSYDKQLYAFNATTGKTLWTASTDVRISYSPAVANGVVYVGSDKLYAFEAATGTTLWTASTGDSIRSSPVVANGMVYVGSGDYKLYAFHLP